MTFAKASMAALGASLALAACGGNDPDVSGNTSDSQNSMDVSTETVPAAPAAAQPSETFTALPEPYKSSDYNRGRRTFKLCQSCHTLNEGGQNLVGPNLYGVFGREIGGVEGFSYSKAVEESDIIWTPSILADWLESPRNFLPGNKMSFAGVRKPEDRTAVIAYIMAETGYSGE